MPNWCANELYIASKNKHTLDAFTKKVGLKDDKPDFDFGKILPEPDYEKVEVLPTFPDIVGDKKPVKSDHAWWDWRVQNWGTKWDACESHICNNDINFFCVSFETAWSPPIDWIDNIMENFPDLCFELEYEEPGMGFGGLLQAQYETIWEDHNWDLE